MVTKTRHHEEGSIWKSTGFVPYSLFRATAPNYTPDIRLDLDDELLATTRGQFIGQILADQLVEPACREQYLDSYRAVVAKNSREVSGMFRMYVLYGLLASEVCGYGEIAQANKGIDLMVPRPAKLEQSVYSAVDTTKKLPYDHSEIYVRAAEIALEDTVKAIESHVSF